MKLTISGYSTALYATWYFVHELGILFDAGDGVTAALAQKTGKVRHIFVSHADRDHLAGLIQLIQLNGKGDSPVVYYPADCGSFPALAAFQKRFDPDTPQCPWQPVRSGDEIPLRSDLVVKAFSNAHVSAPEGVTKSLSYLVEQKKRKLKPEYESLKGAEIGRLRREKGEDYVTDEVRAPILGYSGDTPGTEFAMWQGCEVLIHESTFLNGGDANARHEEKHSVLDDVIRAAGSANLGALILGHFSVRYAPAEIHSAIKNACAARGTSIPVYCVCPMETTRDILRDTPVFSPPVG